MSATARMLGSTTARVLGLALVIGLLTPVPAQAAPHGQFVVRCPYSHTLPDDPIVFPGQPGASHLHDFYGNTTVNAFSSVESLLAGDTTCAVPSDTAGYWAPAAYLRDRQLEPPVTRIYYLGDDPSVETIPPGLQMIGGNPHATSPEENPHVSWYCGQISGVRTPIEDIPYNCGPWQQFGFVDGVIAIVEMPSCWNGTGLAPEDVVYPLSNGDCPSSHSHLLPRLSQRVHLGIMNPLAFDGTVELTLSSGPFYTMHADFWNTWQQTRLDALVRDCLQAGIRCRSIEETGALDWTSQFGTARYDLAYASASVDGAAYVAGFTNHSLLGQHYHRRYDAFVTKLDTSGSVLWTRQLGTSGTDQAYAIAADDDGVWIVGSTDGRFARGASAGGLDAFAAAFGPNGRLRWVRQFGTPRDDEATALALHDGDLFVAGTTSGRLGEGRAGGLDAWVGRFADGGEPRWIRQFGSGATDRARGLAFGRGAVHVVGSTDGVVAGRRSFGGVDAFVQTFDDAGRRGWGRQFGSVGTDHATSVLAVAGRAYVAGVTEGTLGDEPALGGTDAFLTVFTGAGGQLWTRQFGTAGEDDAAAIAGRPRAIYVAGSTTGAFEGQEHLGEVDAFVRRYEPKGVEIWTLQFGTDDYDKVYGLGAELYVAGTTHGAFEGHVNAGDRDVFLTRMALA